MGVVYKIKPHILEFIVQSKKSDPALSCRRFVELVHKEFQVKLSKSSVNSILYGHGLSSPIGRRGPTKRVARKKYEIPLEKKEAIFFSKPAASSALPATPKIDTGINVQSEISPPQSAPIRLDIKKIPASPLGIPCDALGSFFLKAAQWDLTGGSVLGPIFQKYISGADVNILHKAAETFLYAPIFGFSDLDNIDGQNAKNFWMVNEIASPLNSRDLGALLDQIPSWQDVAMNLSIQFSPLTTELSYYKLFLEDKTELFVDTQMTSVWSVAPTSLTTPMNKAINTVTHQIIGNVQSAVFCTMPKESAHFSDLLSAFNNSPGKRIREIGLYDPNHVEMSRYPAINDKKRIFIGGLGPWFPAFQELLNLGTKVDWQEITVMPLFPNLYYKELSYIIKYQNVTTMSFSCRVFFVQNQTQTIETVIITNATADELTAAQAIQAYFRRWPNLKAGFNLCSFQDGNFVKTQGGLDSVEIFMGIETKETVREAILKLFNNYVQRRFFPALLPILDLNQMISAVYRLPGILYFGQDYIKIHLQLPSDHSFPQDVLKSAILRLHENQILDPLGRQIFINL